MWRGERHAQYGSGSLSGRRLSVQGDFRPSTSPRLVYPNREISVNRPADMESYGFPEEHWTDLRGSNPVESIVAGGQLQTNATMRLRSR